MHVGVAAVCASGDTAGKRTNHFDQLQDTAGHFTRLTM